MTPIVQWPIDPLPTDILRRIHPVTDLTKAQNIEELRALLDGITDKADMIASASAFYGTLAVYERQSFPPVPSEPPVPAGFNPVFHHGPLPAAFPFRNERPQEFMGVVLNPNSDAAKAYDKNQPTVEICRLVPVALDEANNLIESRLSELL